MAAATNPKESDDSDDESLPDLSKLITAPPSTHMAKGDIVWAKYKNLYWPALVRSVRKKEKKVCVWFTDDPGKTFKLPFQKVCSFYDSEMKRKIDKDVRAAGCIQEHEGLTSHAMRYLKRKAEGRVDDPMKFFDQTYPFYLVEEHLLKNPGADVSGIKIPPLYLSHSTKTSRKSRNVKNISFSSIESDPETESSDSKSDIKDVPRDYLSEFSQALSDLTKHDENNDKIVNIVNFIKSGKADNYLEKILKKLLPSKHRDAYEREIACNKKQTNPLTYTGPINKDEDIRQLIYYLLNLYENMRGNQRSKFKPSRRSKRKVVNYSSFDIASGHYVASVWLPEAIIYAMSHIYNESLENAKELFEKSTSESRYKEIIHSLLEPEAKTLDSNVIKENQSHDHDNVEMCSPSKKICKGKTTQK